VFSQKKCDILATPVELFSVPKVGFKKLCSYDGIICNFASSSGDLSSSGEGKFSHALDFFPTQFKSLSWFWHSIFHSLLVVTVVYSVWCLRSDSNRHVLEFEASDSTNWPTKALCGWRARFRSWSRHPSDAKGL
jgi:hypothetical protein